MKPVVFCFRFRLIRPAAFRRLCVETALAAASLMPACPAAFRRLCVETVPKNWKPLNSLPAAFRRLCVETAVRAEKIERRGASRLQAAVC